MIDSTRSATTLAVGSFVAGGAVCYSLLCLRSLLDAPKGRKGAREERDGASEMARIGTPHPAMGKYKGCIYLDYNATTPIFPEVSRVMQPFTLSCFGNPSSSHVFSVPCKEAVKTARQHVQSLVNANSADEIIFTSCGTESDNRAIDIAIWAYQNATSGVSSLFKAPLPHVITCSIEHPAVLVYLKHLEKRGDIELTVLPVDEEGTIYPEDINKSLRSNTALVTIMHSNNEVGTIQPIQEIASMIKAYNAKSRDDGKVVLFHSDAAQSLGKVTVDVSVLGVDMLTIVGHKFGAPKGIAALYLRSETCGAAVGMAPLLVGGGQEMGHRGGTENVLLIAGLGEAARLARVDAVDNLFHMLKMKRLLILALSKGVEDLGADFIQFNGPERSNDAKEIASDIALLEMILRPRANGTWKESGGGGGSSGGGGGGGAHVVDDWMKENEDCKYEDGEEDDVSNSDRPKPGAFSAMSSTLVEQLPNTKVACSAGSACHSEAASGDVLSPVLAAMKVQSQYGRGTLRLSFGRHSTASEIELAATHIINSVRACIE